MHYHYLNLGCGSHFHPDWVNVNFTSTGKDVITHNLRQGIPFDDEEFDVVYHSHILEHFPKEEAPYFLQECLRVLKPQGILRVVVPDLEQITRIYLEALEKALKGSTEWSHHYDWILLELYDQVVRSQSGGAMAAYLAQSAIANEAFIIQRLGQEAKTLIEVLRNRKKPKTIKPLSEREALLLELLGSEDYQALQIGRFRQKGEIHQWMYDRYSLKVLLESVGFQNISVCQHNESQIHAFESYGLDSQSDGTARKPDSLFVEATKSKPTNTLAHNLEHTLEMAQPPSEPSNSLTHQSPKALEELPYVQALQSQVQALQSNLEHLEETIEHLEDKLGKVRKRAKRFKLEVNQLQMQQQELEQSSFGQMRRQWIAFKNWLEQK